MDLKLTALIIDDEPLAHQVILNFAKDVPQLEIVGQSFLAVDALSFLQKQSVDLLFLDMQMPKLHGMDFLRILDKKPLVIITSAYQEFALESYEQDVCDYLLKPFRFDRFLKAVHKAAELKKLRTKPAHKQAVKMTPQASEPLFIKSDKRHIQLQAADIFYLESHGNYVKVWLADTYHLTPRTLSSFEHELSSDIFIRIHKSYLVNLQHLHYLEGNELILKNGKALLVGRTYRQEVRALIERS